MIDSTEPNNDSSYDTPVTPIILTNDGDSVVDESQSTVHVSGGSVKDNDARSEVPKDTPGGDPSTVRPVEIPQTIGRFRILRLLGKGGFGAVYEAFDPQLDRSVALKVPHLKKDDDDVTAEAQSEFLKEAKRLAQLTHPSIVRVFDVGFEDNVCFIVSDLLKGQNLGVWIRDREISWQESVEIVSSLAGALAAAHAVGIIHRDVKTDNILMTERTEGTIPVLVDFGLAVRDSEEPRHLSKRGVITGTPEYMAPEQAFGQGHRIDGRTDIYSLGVVLYRLLCGETPFRNTVISELLQQVIYDEPRPPRQFVKGIPRELERICLKAMSKQISDRYTTALDMAEDLEQCLKAEEPRSLHGTISGHQMSGSRFSGSHLSRSTEFIGSSANPSHSGSSFDGLRILIAEDNEATRFKLKNDLEKWGHYVVAAEDGQQAWEMFQEDEYSMVITDWMMPNMDGVQLVQHIRAAPGPDYVYVIMLTAKAEKQDIVAGMGAGADDFLAKPLHRDELNVRLRAGRRIIELTRVLGESNRRMKLSLGAAAKIQRSFLPTSLPDVPGFNFAWNYSPSDDLGGDMLNIVRLDDQQLGMYILEVSGHGVPASLLSTTLCRELASADAPHSVLVDRDRTTNAVTVLEPADVMRRLAQLFVSSKEAGQFITMIYGILDVKTSEFRYSSAGNPPVVLQQKTAVPELLYASGMPIGLTPDHVDYEQRCISLRSGDRLFIYSDGLTDTQNPTGELFGSRGVVDALQEQDEPCAEDSVARILRRLEKWRSDAEITDDVSVLSVCAT